MSMGKIMRRPAFYNALLLLLAIFFCTPAHADEDRPTRSYTWKKGYLNIGYYFAGLDSSFRLGDQNLGLGLDIDVESLLRLDTTDSSFRIDGGYRFGRTQRHKVEFGWFRFHREGTTFLDQKIEVPDLPDGSGGSNLGPGTFESVFNFDIIELTYSYSYVFDERVDLNIGAGFYVMPIEFGFIGVIDGVGQSTVRESITAPLPAVGLGFDFAITPQWYIRQDADLFYLEIDSYKGGIANLLFALEYLPWKHVGFGAGVNWMQVFVEVDGDTDVPGVDFVGDVEFSYFGALLYLKLFM